MSEHNYQLGQLVELTGKNLQGRIAYIGLTHFSAGEWIGVVLDEEKGRNDGTVRGHCYFQCEANHGIFVRPAQLKALDDGASTTPSATTTSKPSATSLNLLKTTQISAPKLVTPCRTVISASSSQQSLLPTVANVLSASSSAVKCCNLATPLPPKRSKTAVSLTATSFCCAKRSSFVETGFLEILQPQFTPGLPLRSPSVHLLATNKKEQLQQHSELQTKLETLEAELEAVKLQRADDKSKLQELERLRFQNEKLLEFKVKIMEQHGALQRELQRSRYEIRESNDARGSCMRELAELQDSVELVTLDKEMAEERAETLQLELEIANERIEELQLDVEIMRAELENKSITAAAGTVIKDGEELKPSYGQLRKLEQHNQRLKQTIISLRDLLAQEKNDLLKTTKELETKYSEIAELKKTKELFAQRIDLMEQQIMDLKEQVDASLGAETMVETLAEEKLELEERVKLLEEEVAELEALEEIHEQIIESNQELELDLREELEALNKNVRTLQQEKNLTLETIYDRDSTIQKFRELVRNLNETQLQYKDRDTTASILDDFNTTSLEEEETPTSLDYNQLFSLTKASGREIDMALSKMELKLAKMQCEYLLAFMPENFMLRGGDNDVITLLITLQRLTEKVNIICNTINERFPATYELDGDGEAIFEGFSIHRYAFRCKSLFFLRTLKTMLQQVLCCMQHAEYESGCKQAAAYRAEVIRHEQHIDELLKLLKSGELDENTSTSAIENAINFVNFLHSNLLVEQHCNDLLDEHQLFHALLDIYEVATDGVAINAALIQRIIQLGDECSESFAMMQSLVEGMDTFRRQLKVLRLKMPNCSIRFNELQQNQMQRIKITNGQLGKLLNVLSISAKDALRIISTMKFDDTMPGGAIEHTRIWKIITINCFKLNTTTEVDKGGPHQFVEATTELLNEQISGILKFIEEQEGAKVTNINTVHVRSSTHAILTRAAQVRQQWEDVNNTLVTLEAREKEIRTLKYVVKMKQTEFSEMQIRKEMTERNLSKTLAEHEAAMNAILNITNNLEQSYVDREHLLMASLSAAERKLSILQDQLLKLQQHLKTSNTRNTLDCEHTLVDLRVLNDTLRSEYRERKTLQGDRLKIKLKLLEPIIVPQVAIKHDETLAHFEKSLRHIKNDWILSYIDLRRNSSSVRTEIKTKSKILSGTILSEYFSRHPHRVIESDFGTFVTNDVKALWH